MLKLPNILPGLISTGETETTPRLPNCTPPWPPTPSVAQIAAKAAVDRLFGWCQMPDVGDAKVYLTGAIAILAEYPQGVMDKIADPRTGTRVLKDFPSLALIRKACDDLNEPFDREAERERAHAEARPLALRKLRTPEEQAAAEAHVAAVRKQFGIPEAGLERRRWMPHTGLRLGAHHEEAIEFSKRDEFKSLGDLAASQQRRRA